jgi:hypothetical protein
VKGESRVVKNQYEEGRISSLGLYMVFIAIRLQNPAVVIAYGHVDCKHGMI